MDLQSLLHQHLIHPRPILPPVQPRTSRRVSWLRVGIEKGEVVEVGNDLASGEPLHGFGEDLPHREEEFDKVVV